MKLFSKLSENISAIFTKKKLDRAALDALEDLLIMGDVGVKTAGAIIAEISEGRVDKDINDEEIKALLAQAIATKLSVASSQLRVQAVPTVILMVGVNGNGKTTTAGKLAAQYQNAGKNVVLVAADTFRAAAVEQLEQWATLSGAAFVRGPEKSDPAAVAYQGVEQALNTNADIVIIDTAGRLHTKQNLMAELEKIIKVIRKKLPDAPHHVIQVLDATTGANALTQVREFAKTAGVTGLIVTKLDGTAKAGVVVALVQECKLPIYAIGVGEGINDLHPFDCNNFSKSLVGLSGAAGNGNLAT